MSTHPPVHSSSADVSPAARLARRVEMDELLLRLSNRFIGVEAEALDAAIDWALEELGRFAAVSSSYLFELDAFHESASKLYEWRARAVPSTREAFEGVTAEAMPTLFRRAVGGELLRINELSELGSADPAERQQFQALSIAAFVAVPVKLRGRVVGLLGFDQHDEPRHWSDEEVLLLRMAADMLAQALDRRGAHDRLMFHIHNTPLSVVEWDERWRVRRWSPQAQQLFGWSAREVTGRDWGAWKFVFEKDLPRVENVTRRLIDGTDSSNSTVNRNYTRSGRVLACEWFNSVQRDRTGRIVSVLSFVQDVTKRQKTQWQLHQSRAELQQLNAELEQRVARRTEQLESLTVRSEEQARALEAILDAGPDHVYLVDSHGCCRYVGRAVLEDLGRERDELIGRTAGGAGLPGQVVSLFEGAVRRVLADGWPRREEADLPTMRGLRRFEYSLTPVYDGREQVSAVLCSGRDVTARRLAAEALRASETRYRTLTEHATDLITVHDMGGYCTFVSPVCRRLLGYEPEELIGKPPFFLVHPEDQTLGGRTLARLQASREVVNTAYRARRKDGRYIWLESSSRCDGREMIVVSRDISARKSAEQAAQAHRDELAHVTRLSTMGEMASGLAHELNQPLTAIHNYLNGTIQRLHTDRLSRDELLTALRHVAEQAERAGQIIRRLRAFVIKRGMLRKPEDLNHLVRETVALVEADARERHARIELALDDDLPPIHVDGVQIEQVLLNLIRNGLEAMDARLPGQRLLRIETRRDGDGQVRASVIDRGTGLSQSQRNHLFDPFFTTKEQGMGMGLTISQSIAQAHEGRLWVGEPPPPAPGDVSGEEAQGCTMHLTLPAAEVSV